MVATSPSPLAKHDLDAMEHPKPNGPALAALVGAGIGCTVLGVLTTIAEASADFGKLLAFNKGVGPLAGKTTYAVAAFLVSWAVLAFVMRGKQYNERPLLTLTFALIGIGFLGTFPLFFDLFAK